MSSSRGSKQYQKAIRPTLPDLLGFPAWLTNLLSHRRRARATAAFNEFDRVVDRLISARAVELSDGPSHPSRPTGWPPAMGDSKAA